MSASGRNLPGRERDPRDFYETSAWCATQGAQVLARYAPAGAWVCDPGAGRGALVRAAVVAGFRAFGIEQDPALAVESGGLVFPGDFLTPGPASNALDLLPGVCFLANPPYHAAEGFVRRCMGFTPGACVFLLRLGFLASRRRRNFWREYAADVYVSAKRPSFAHGGTDSAEYGWFAFRKRDARADTITRLEAPNEGGGVTLVRS